MSLQLEWNSTQSKSDIKPGISILHLGLTTKHTITKEINSGVLLSALVRHSSHANPGRLLPSHSVRAHLRRCFYEVKDSYIGINSVYPRRYHQCLLHQLSSFKSQLIQVTFIIHSSDSNSNSTVSHIKLELTFISGDSWSIPLTND